MVDWIHGFGMWFWEQWCWPTIPFIEIGMEGP
jgi:hypothetical protein